MNSEATSSGLPPKLDALLAQMPDREYAAKLHMVYGAATIAIEKLSDMDLVKYETANVESSPDLSLWEEMAPVLRDTVVDVNQLLLVMREQFPAHQPGGLGDTLFKAIEEVGGVDMSPDERRTSDAEKVIRRTSESLAQEVTKLGERMRSPQVVSDRWNLLAELQAFRTRFREMIAALVYETASAFGEVSRKDVVPFYGDEVKAALAVRGTVGDLIRIITARMDKIREAEPEDVQWNAQQLEKELDIFGKTPAYRALRAQDKRQVIEVRSTLGELARKSDVPKKALIELVEPFAEFVQALTSVNKRELLVEHDREVCASIGVKIEHAQGVIGGDPDSAASVLGEAASEAQSLYGRDSDLDAFLRKAKKNPVSALRGAELYAAMERFQELIAKIQIASI